MAIVVRCILALCALALLAGGQGAVAQNWEAGTKDLVPIPALAARVTDVTGTLAPAQKGALEDRLARYEQATGNQLVVLLVGSTQPEPIEAYSIRVAEAWKIGRKGADNGVLFVVAKNDHKMRIEVGYGLEGVLTDVQARRIIADDVAPHFRKDDFAGGIGAGVDRIIAITSAAPGTTPAATSAPVRNRGGGIDLQTWLVVLLVGVPVVGGVLKRLFGRFVGSLLGGGVIGGGAWLVAGSIAVAGVAGIVAFIVLLFLGLGSGFGNRGGMYLPTGGWGGGFGGRGSGFGGGGGFSGGGGSFGGGGASGGW